jgi:uncharacterized membrane protein HdeD (DUF308 family)
MTSKTYPPGTVLMSPMLEPLARNWWLILLRGALSILFGVLTLVWPGLTLFTLIIFYGVFALFDGFFSLAAAITGGTPMPRWWLALVGILGILVGLVTLAWPGITGIVLLYFIAGWAIASGAFQIVGAIRLRKEIEDEWLLIASGIVSVLFGLLILGYPVAGALGVAFAIGIFAIVYGGLSIGLGLKLKKHAEVKV